MAPERHAARKEAERCEVSGCTELALRSLPTSKLAKAGLSLAEGAGGRARLCRTHYRQFKKATREEREFESLGW